MERFGLVGLPNAGKSSLYNALTNGAALAAPYPFATKDPNIGVAKVLDPRLEALAEMSKTQRTVYATVEVVDIGGLVEGASKGEGLGNKFLANIREVDAIAHVVRCFVNDDIVHVAGRIDPLSDIEIINTELALADLETAEKALQRAEKAAKTQDITAGLPRISELFEARPPKDAAEIAKIDGTVRFEPSVRGKKRLVIADSIGREEEHLIPHGKHIIVAAGDKVKQGQVLTDGAVDPHDILDILGQSKVQDYLITEIQKVYRTQGVVINDKHIEIIVSRMLRKVRITEPGDSDYLWGEQVDRTLLAENNRSINERGGQIAESEPILLGITKASLETESFISAASFQETTRVLTDAATMAKRDNLTGFKENVIMGHLVPAGTGLPAYRRIRVFPTEATA